jgi:hypothetical protein
MIEIRPGSENYHDGPLRADSTSSLPLLNPGVTDHNWSLQTGLINFPSPPNDGLGLNIVLNCNFETYLMNERSDLGAGGIVRLHTLHFELADMYCAGSPLTELINTSVDRFRPRKSVSLRVSFYNGEDHHNPLLVSNYNDLIRGMNRKLRVNGAAVRRFRHKVWRI